MQLKNARMFIYGASPMRGLHNGADRTVAKVVQRYRLVGENLEDEDNADVLEM